MHSEPPAQAGTGLCPRGLAIGELLDSPARIRWAAAIDAGRRRELPADEARREIVNAAGGRQMVVFLDGTLPCEQILAADAACRVWPGAKLCVLIDPAERELLLGTESSGAEYLADADLAACDAFLIVGDAFAANPACSRGVFESRAANPRVPIATIDPGAGSAGKFASIPVATPPGGELAALAAVARAAGLDAPEAAAPAGLDESAARSAGAALAKAKRPAVIFAAEFGRGGAWRQIGCLGGKLAAGLGGGVACQTHGANALAAVRLEPRLETIGLADALGRRDEKWIVIGCDVLGLLGITNRPILAAGAALPNRTTEAAKFVLPTALAAELDGTYLLGNRLVRVAAAAPPPAGVPAPADLVAALARAAGANAPAETADVGELARRTVDAPKPAPTPTPPAEGAVLLLGRCAADAGCGELTSHATFQSSVGATPTLRLAAGNARKLGLKNLDMARVRSGGASLQARVLVSPSLGPAVAVLPESLPDARAMCPCQRNGDDEVAFLPAAATIEAVHDYASQET